MSATPTPWSEILATMLPSRSRSSISSRRAAPVVAFTPAATGRTAAEAATWTALSRLRRPVRSVGPSSAAAGRVGWVHPVGGLGSEVVVGVLVGHLDEDPRQSGAVGDGVMEPDHDRAEVGAVDDVRPPEGPVVRDRLAQPGLQERLELRPTAGALELVLGHMSPDVEVQVVDPLVARADRVGGPGLPVEHRVPADHPLVVHRDHAVVVQSMVEPLDGLDHHEILGRVHVQPERVVGRQLHLSRLRCGVGHAAHAAVSACRVSAPEDATAAPMAYNG